MNTPVIILGQEATAPPATTAATAPPNPGLLPTAPASSGLPTAAAGGITLSLLFVALVVTFIAVKAYKVKVGAVLLGVCIGVLGAGGFIGALAWALIGVGVKVVSSLASSFG